MKISSHIIRYIVIRTVILMLTIFTAFTITYFLLRALPVNAVENVIRSIISKGRYYDPKVLIELRNTLYEVFGLSGSPIEQYFNYLRKFLTLDFGYSILVFGTSVKYLISLYLPYSLFLLGITTIISWIIGNLLGVFVGVRRSKISSALQSLALVLYPLPYYVLALIMIYVFGYLVPLLPLVGGAGTTAPLWSLEFVLDLLRRSILPALSIIIVSALGWWFISSRVLAINIYTEDYTAYAILRGVSINRLLRKYILRNILLPQTTTLALSMGSIFSGALIVEAVFNYPGVGMLLYRSVFSGDYPTALGILSLSIIGTSIAAYIIDLIYPLLDPRIRYR